jgi:hypothetical protein
VPPRLDAVPPPAVFDSLAQHRQQRVGLQSIEKGPCQMRAWTAY